MRHLTTSMLLVIAFYHTACTTGRFMISDAEHMAENGDLHTLRYTYGSLPEEDLRLFRDSYDQKLADKANEICEKRGYEILEKGRHPSTLAHLKSIGPNDYFWVIRCEKAEQPS